MIEAPSHDTFLSLPQTVIVDLPEACLKLYNLITKDADITLAGDIYGTILSDIVTNIGSSLDAYENIKEMVHEYENVEDPALLESLFEAGLGLFDTFTHHQLYDASYVTYYDYKAVTGISLILQKHDASQYFTPQS